MTISSTTRVAGPFIGSGTAATFPFTFAAFEATDLEVAMLDVATGAITILALTTDYTVSLNEDQDSSPGGSITLTAGNLATGYTLTLTTDIPELQGVDLTNGGAFYPDVINSALDLLTILIQQLYTQASRSIQLPIVEPVSNVTLPPAPERANKIVGFDNYGNLTLVQYDGGGGGGSPTTVELPPSSPGNFTVAHGLPFTPSAVVIVPTSAGAIWLQGPMSWDATNLDLAASAAGVTANAVCFP